MLTANMSLLQFQDPPVQVKGLRIASPIHKRLGKVGGCYRIEVLFQSSGVHSDLGNSHLKSAKEPLPARRARMVLVLAVLVRFHNAGHMYKPARTCVNT